MCQKQRGESVKSLSMLRKQRVELELQLYSILTSALENWGNVTGFKWYGCMDIWELSTRKLAEHNRIQVVWVPGHMGTQY
jgi:hypothetical protein